MENSKYFRECNFSEPKDNSEYCEKQDGKLFNGSKDRKKLLKQKSSKKLVFGKKLNF